MGRRSVEFIRIADYTARAELGATSFNSANMEQVAAPLKDCFRLHLGYGRLERRYRQIDVVLCVDCRDETANATHKVNAVV